MSADPALPFDWAVGHPFQEIPQELAEPPVPGGVAAAVRWFFAVPQWIQIGGAVVAGLLLLAVLVFVWRRRRTIWGWVVTRQRGLQIAMAGAIFVVLIVAAGFGRTSWNYMQHDNDFCVGCHVMDPAAGRFIESEHADLECHDCHRQSIFASARQLVLWVADRPDEIGEHAPVPNRICAECHITEDPDSTWQRISATAGHRVHLESDSVALSGVMCVTCHGQEVHRFVPADETCAQADCHAAETTEIVLGEMSGQTGFHCVTCHEFTAAVSEEIAADSARQGLVPAQSQCFSCHDMESQLVSFDQDQEVHGAVCGACHNPHDQETPAQAFSTCADAGCHAQADTLTPFHVGLPNGLLEDCAECHSAHTWTVDGENCGACHTPASLVQGPPVPVRLASAGGAAARAPGPQTPPWLRGPFRHEPLLAAHPQESDGFRHADHESVACTDCHSSADAHGSLAFQGEAGCVDCHHGAGAAGATCESCHGAAELAGVTPVALDITLTVWEGSRSRALPFDHSDHPDLACADCHSGDNVLEVETSCADCHSEHHRSGAQCIACHEAASDDAHTVAVHTDGCAGSGCHDAATDYFALERTRSFCLGCHQDQVEHEPTEACIRCHLVPADAQAWHPVPTGEEWSE